MAASLATRQPVANAAPASRPILFSGPMVRALLAGTKSQTRRIIHPQPTGEPRPLSDWSESLAAACHDSSPDPEKLRQHSERLRGRIFPFTDGHGLYSPSCPKGKPGDLLWVRETWGEFRREPGKPVYRADYEYALGASNPWRPSIHMPRKYSRITLRITDVRVQQLHAITDEDAIAEGVEPEGDGWKSYEVIKEGRYKGERHPHAVVPNRSPVTSYRELWEAINGPHSWALDPYVWVLEFERVTP